MVKWSLLRQEVLLQQVIVSNATEEKQRFYAALVIWFLHNSRKQWCKLELCALFIFLIVLLRPCKDYK